MRGMVHRVRYSLALLFIVVLSGCGGGFNCPFNPPQCCYNVLFGCGPFDIPFGCECSSYGLARVAPAKSAMTFAGATVDNVWNGTLSRQSSSCPGLPKTLRGKVVVKTTGRRISITVPGYGVLRGQRRGRVYRATGSYAPFTPTCKGIANVTVNPNGRLRAGIGASMTYSCGAAPLCSARYNGALSR